MVVESTALTQNGNDFLEDFTPHLISGPVRNGSEYRDGDGLTFHTCCDMGISCFPCEKINHDIT